MENSIIMHNVAVDEFYERLRITIRDEIVSHSSIAKETENLSTRRETATRLRITLPTLNEYTKKGLLKGVRIGSRVLYREEDILAALRDIPSTRNRR